MPGEIRKPVRSGPISSAMAVATSMAKRARFAIEPPYSSVRRLALGAKNWLYQIAIRAVDLDTVGAGFNGTPGGMAEILHGCLDLFGRQGARCWRVLHAGGGEHLLAGSHG